MGAIFHRTKDRPSAFVHPSLFNHVLRRTHLSAGQHRNPFGSIALRRPGCPVSASTPACRSLLVLGGVSHAPLARYAHLSKAALAWKALARRRSSATPQAANETPRRVAAGCSRILNGNVPQPAKALV